MTKDLHLLRGRSFAALRMTLLYLLLPLSAHALTCNGLTLPHPAKRIISLAPDITENLFVINAAKQIVGVDSNSDYPKAAKRIQHVGNYTGIDTERMVVLHPDLILTWGQTFASQLAILHTFGIAIVSLHYEHLADIPRVLQQLGCLTGHVKEAQAAGFAFNQEQQALATHYASYPPVRVFYQLSVRPLMTINEQSWISDVITLCGGVNIFAKTPLLAPIVDIESVLQAKPEVIIGTKDDDHWQQTWLAWQTLPAVKNKTMYAINPSLIERASPRVLLGAKQICQYLHK